MSSDKSGPNKSDDGSPRLKIGVVVGVHGVGGGLRVTLHDPDSESLVVGRHVVFEGAQGQSLRAKIIRVAKNRGEVAAKIWVQEVSDRDSAGSLRGASVTMDRDQLPSLASDEFFLADAIGKTLRLVGSGHEVGVVESIASNGAQDLFVCTWTDAQGKNHEWMFPAMRPFLSELTAQALWVEIPEGFLPDVLETLLGRGGALIVHESPNSSDI
jgi:16S rRNA processing protein RimM